MFKKAKVVMLATNQKAIISSFTTSKNLLLTQPELIGKEYDRVFNHLYIISDVEIKEGDWYFFGNRFDSKELHQFEKDIDSTEFLKEYGIKKIIATTDESLSYWIHETYPNGNTKGIKTLIELPQPSQSFIDKYITEYNKGNIITDIMVEYEEVCDVPRHLLLTHTPEEAECMKHPYLRLKVNPKDNTITIKRIKDSWTREEVKQLMELSYNEGYSTNGDVIDIDKWIEDNL